MSQSPDDRQIAISEPRPVRKSDRRLRHRVKVQKELLALPVSQHARLSWNIESVFSRYVNTLL